MHSLKPTGDNIAQEFFRLLNKKAQDIDPQEMEAAIEDIEEGGSILAEHQEAMAEQLAASGQSDEAGSDEGFDEGFDFEEMITEPGEIQTDDSAMRAIDTAADMLAMSSEDRVLSGLNKIASNLRLKGEAFAADVVEATASGIRSDMKKEAQRKSDIVAGLRKIANDFYADNENLAGDMVTVTINKISNDLLGQMGSKLDNILQNEEAKPLGAPAIPNADSMLGKGRSKLDSLLSKQKANSKAMFAKTKAEAASVIAAAIKAAAKAATTAEKMDAFLNRGVTEDASGYTVELQTGEKVRVTK